MTKRLPETVKESVGHLRNNVMTAFDRWLPERFKKDHDGEELLWPGSVFTLGGPPVDVTEDAEAVYVVAELPGLSQKDFSVQLEKRRLILRGEKKAGHEERRREGYFSECSYGSFTRTIPLPCEIDADKVSAKYKHGVLTVTLPKTEEARAHRVNVTIS